jgi:hypothetical protein
LQKFASFGGLALLLISLAFFPGWPKSWLGRLHYTTYLRAPIVELGGVAILLVLLRWRRPEARLIALLACVPQVGSWYEALPVLLVPSTLNEAMVLASLSSLGWLAEDHLLTAPTEIEVNQQLRALVVAFVYLPAVIMVLRRPNESEAPVAPQQ